MGVHTWIRLRDHYSIFRKCIYLLLSMCLIDKNTSQSTLQYALSTTKWFWYYLYHLLPLWQCKYIFDTKWKSFAKERQQRLSDNLLTQLLKNFLNFIFSSQLYIDWISSSNKGIRGKKFSERWSVIQYKGILLIYLTLVPHSCSFTLTETECDSAIHFVCLYCFQWNQHR